MSYTIKFSSQWDNLVADFAAKIENTPTEFLSPSELNDWYQTRSYRWSSISEAEGVMLEQEADNDFRNEMISSIADFEFKEPTVEKVSLSASRIVIGIITAIAVAAISNFFLSLGLIKTIILALIISVSFTIKAFLNKSSAKKNAYKKVRSVYIEQLHSHGKKLLEICNKYGK